MSQAVEGTIHDPHTEAQTSPEGNHVPSQYIPNESVCTWAYLGFALEIDRFAIIFAISVQAEGKERK